MAISAKGKAPIFTPVQEPSGKFRLKRAYTLRSCASWIRPVLLTKAECWWRINCCEEGAMAKSKRAKPATSRRAKSEAPRRPKPAPTSRAKAKKGPSASWLLRPPAPGVVHFYFDAAKDVTLTPQAEQALQILSRELLRNPAQSLMGDCPPDRHPCPFNGCTNHCRVLVKCPDQVKCSPVQCAVCSNLA